MLVHLHIGTPKSGTTYLQGLMDRNRERLAADGVLWYGDTWNDQVFAVRDVLEIDPHDEPASEVVGAWSRFVEQVHAWSGESVVLSMEWMVHATPEQVRAVVDSLAPHRVRVVVTARDIARTVPAQWQEQVQNWATWTWEEYVAAVTSPDPRSTGPGRQLFDQYDLTSILPNWLAVLPVEDVTVVTVPGSGAPADLLWQRFAQAIGVDPGPYDTDVPVSNGSLGAASAELMRRVNVASREAGVTWQDGDPILKWALAKGVLSYRAGQEPKLRLPAEHHDWAVAEAERLVDGVQQLGVPVIGDVDELRVTGSGRAGTGEVSAEQIVEAAVQGLAGLARHIADRNAAERRAAELRRQEEAARLAAEAAEQERRARRRPTVANGVRVTRAVARRARVTAGQARRVTRARLAADR
ncbi:hypothetical protein [Geodermatophilus chilensis]|uniref:hypothetical protein n=1 Tax=Geodermatophilus chilensis TaxID=2035835 RepID=UPI000C256E41|nr:hypothetical protein [Geodermatophilus chilensis]